MNTSPGPRDLPRRSIAAAAIALPALWLGPRGLSNDMSLLKPSA